MTMRQVPDPYRALGVARGASDTEIKAAHRRLAKRHHPDAEGGDTHTFLSVQEAYRVLSDPILRREWDARHAPGPVRADQPAGSRKRPTRPRQPKPQAEGAAPSRPPAGPGQPRSSRAYTWSAAEVPWWEEGARREARRDSRRAAREQPHEHESAAPDMDVYNRSSGAAWSMAARAYFRRGDRDLPRRGSFRHQGTQPLTGARARAAAEAEARRQAAPAGDASPHEREAPEPPPQPARRSAAPRQPAYAYATAGVARDAYDVARARERFARRMRGEAWPSLGQRLLLSLLAWLPLAGVAAYSASLAVTDEIAAALAIGAGLALFVVLPRIAYFAALATVGAAVAAAVALTVLAVLGARMPLTSQSVVIVASVALSAYVATIGAVLIFGQRSRPWSR